MFRGSVTVSVTEIFWTGLAFALARGLGLRLRLRGVLGLVRLTRVALVIKLEMLVTIVRFISSGHPKA